MKSLSTINLAIEENTDCSIIKAHAPAINQISECVTHT